MHISKALSAPELIGNSLEEVKQLIVKIEQITNSICMKSNENFLIVPFEIQNLENNKKRITEYPSIEAHLAAEGHRKIAMLSYLIKNGTIKPKISLFWDEPEANLNPKLLKALAGILVELSSIMQITIATHSLFLLREIDIAQRKNKDIALKFFGLYRGDSGVSVISGAKISDIGDVAALDASLEQTDRFMAVRSL